jgi:hypothetical protein
MSDECPDRKRLRIIAEDLDRCDPGNEDAKTMFRAVLFWEEAERDERRIDWLAETYGNTLGGLLPAAPSDNFDFRDHLDLAAGTWPSSPGESAP